MIYDLVIKYGHVIDPATGLDRITDIALKDGKIAAISDGLTGKEVLDAKGCIVTKGLIDLHTHVYWGGTSLGVDPDFYSARSAVTTSVDAGSAGPGNFAGFEHHIITKARSRVLAFVHVSFAGIYAFSSGITVGESEQLRLMAPRETLQVCRDYPNSIVGIKVRIGRNASGPSGIMPLDVALDLGNETGLPLMVHIDEPPPSYEEVVSRLRPGDILTHCWRGFPNAPVDGKGQLREGVRDARARGVLFDIGHGMGSFAWRTARTLMTQGITPDCISSDVHALCIDGPARDLLLTMTKFMALGMPLSDIITRVTTNPANAIRRPDLGSLAIGSAADISVFRITEGALDLRDAEGEVVSYDRNLEPVAVIVGGRRIS